jgi:D-lactate dehydrogenase
MSKNINQKNIIFLEVEPQDEQQIRNKYPKCVIECRTLSEEEIIRKYPDAEILCVFIYSKISKKCIESLANLKLIVTRSVGYDHIDLKAANERDVPVCNVPDYGSHVIAEHVFALLLSAIRLVKQGDDQVEKKSSFDFHGLRGVALKGKTLGIVGVGKIGKNVARIASLGFLMDVIAFDIDPDEDIARECHFSYVPLEKIWKKSDVITFHVPLLERTRHLVNENTISQMKNGVVLINTARGGVIDTKALVRGIKTGKIGHAALDVLEHEQNIREDEKLINLPQVIITPHIAFYADDSMKKMYSEAIVSLDQFCEEQKLKYRVKGE